jgi:predicted PP-loop superfamily ATPase
MRFDSPLWRSYHKAIHVLRPDSLQRILGVFVRGITSDPHAEWCNISIDPGLIASLREAGRQLVGF